MKSSRFLLLSLRAEVPRGEKVLNGAREIRFQADNITCSSCAEDMEKILRATPGILDASVNFLKETVHVRYDPGILDKRQVYVTVRRLGYPLKILSEGE